MIKEEEIKQDKKPNKQFRKPRESNSNQTLNAKPQHNEQKPRAKTQNNEQKPNTTTQNNEQKLNATTQNNNRNNPVNVRAQSNNRNNLVNVKTQSTNNAVNVKSSNSQQKNQKQPNAFKLTFLGGVGEIGKNMLAVEYENDIIVVDAGSAFPGEDLPGVDLVVPDITYLTENIDRVRAVVITHGHEDHIGAIAYFLKQINIPVYGSRLTCALIENKLKEHRVKAKLITVKQKTSIKIGSMEVEFLKAQHSIGGAFSLAITTPVGVYFHTSDFKIDYTPVDGEGMDFVRMGELAKKGVLLLTSDSTNAERKGFSISESRVSVTLDGILSQNKAKRIFIATFASNVHRVQQICNLAKKYNRKIAFSGRSMIRTMETAHKIGEITFEKSRIIDITQINNYKDEEVLVLTTGTQGEPNSALVRMAGGDFNKVELGENDLIILSSSAIPGNEKTINDVMNKLYKRGTTIIYESLAEVHTSGHAFQEELKTMIALLKPKYFMPVHGEFRQQIAHTNIAIEMGYNKRDIIIAEIGDQILISKNLIKKSGTVTSGVKLIDGIGVEDATTGMIRDRMQLSEEGLLVVSITVSMATGSITSKPSIITRGFMLNKENGDITEEARNIVVNTVLDADFKKQDWNTIRGSIRKNLANFYFRKIRRRPLILPIIIETK